MPALTQSEIDERAGILRRFRETLLKQRERFSRYLRMLEESPDEEWTNPDQIEIHVEIEQAIVREISSFEQVIEPLEVLYRESDPAGAADLPQLKAALLRTREEVLSRTADNRELLKAHITAIRSEISGLKVMKQLRSVYATPEPTTIDISA